MYSDRFDDVTHPPMAGAGAGSCVSPCAGRLAGLVFTVVRVFTVWVGLTGVGAFPVLAQQAAPPTEQAAPSWTDRRPVAWVFLSQVHFASPTNPDGYLGPDVTTTTSEGRADFRRRLLELADQIVARCKRLDAQGVIVWDIEGARQRGMMYVGDPRVLPDYAPAMDAVADAFFQRLTAAGLRVGVTLRPNDIFVVPPENRDKYGYWGYRLYRSDQHDVVAQLSDRVRYAQQRWGCTLFYVDSNFYMKKVGDRYQRTNMSADMWRELHQSHPDALFMPEHETGPDYWRYSAPYQQWDMRQHTPAKVRSRWPGAFSVIQASGHRVHAQWRALVDAVEAGDVLIVDGWYSSARNVQVQAAYQAAQAQATGPSFEAGEIDDASLIERLAPASPQLDRYHAIRELGERKVSAAAPPIAGIVTDGDQPWFLRRAACAALGRIGAPDAVPALLEVSQRREAELAVHALGALFDMPEPPEEAIREALVRSKNRLIREQLCLAVLVHPTPVGARLAGALLDDPIAAVHTAAAHAIRVVAERSTVPASVAPKLRRYLASDARVQARTWAAQSLSRMGDRASIKAIANYLAELSERGNLKTHRRLTVEALNSLIEGSYTEAQWLDQHGGHAR